MNFLVTERASVVRLAELQKKKVMHQSGTFVTAGDRMKSAFSQKGKPSCAVHKENSKHKTADCNEFKKFLLDDKLTVLRSVHACFRCFGYHRREHCNTKVYCQVCEKSGHLTLMCKRSSNDSASDTQESASSSSCKDGLLFI